MSRANITLTITNVSIYIDGHLPSDIYQGLKKTLGYIPEDAVFMVKNKKSYWGKNKWDGHVSLVCRNKTYCKCPNKKDGIHFPTGLFRKAKDFFDQNDVRYIIKDARKQLEKNLDIYISSEAEVRDYQTDIAEKAVRQQRSLLQMATAGGKTFTGAKIIQGFGVAPFIFYVPSIDLVKQTREELHKFLVDKDGNHLNIGAIGGGVYDPQDITVITTQTAVRACGAEYVKSDDEDEVEKEENVLKEKRKEILDLITSAKGIIFDECQHVAAETSQIIADYSVSARYRCGMSATVFRDKNDDILIEACLGKMCGNISASFLIEKGYLVKPYIYFIRHTPKNISGHTYSSIYKNAIVEDEERNNIIARLASQMAQKGKNVLVLIKNISHGKTLEKIIPDSVFIYGKHSGEERHEHFEKIRKSDSNIMIASTILDEGVNIKNLDVLIMAASGKSVTRALQRIGRILRTYTNPVTQEKKKEAIIIDFEDHCKYLLQHSRKRKKIYMSEPAFHVEYLDI